MKQYKLRPPQKIEKRNEKNGENELVEDENQHPEDRSIERVEVIPDEQWNQLPDFAKEQIQKEKSLGNTTPANLKNDYEEAWKTVQDGIKRCNEIATQLAEISEQFPELQLTGLPSQISFEDKIKDLDKKKPKMRKKKEKKK